MTAAGQDGERLVMDEIVHKANDLIRDYYRLHGHYAGAVRAALTAVAPDLDRAGYDRARRECADELRGDHPEDWKDNAGETDLHPWCWRCKTSWPCWPVQLADRWSPSGRAPAGEEEQR